MSNFNKRNPIAKAVKLALLAGATMTALSSPIAFADDEEDEDENTVTVTGSRIKRTDIETASPVFVTSSQDIKNSGFTRIEDLMNSLPQIEAADTSFDVNGATGTASVDLRGLGPVRTLVLINGRRMQPGNIYAPAPDINQIPAALVDRVEVMTGGGASTYGADAVAGVVNFIMKDDFDGLEVVVGTSGYQHDNDNSYIQGLMDAKSFVYPSGSSGFDGKTNNVDITLGGDFDGGRGHATAYATWREVNELRQGARDYSSCALNAAGTTCGGSLNTIIPSFFIGNIDPETGAQDDYQLWTLDPTTDGFMDQDTTRYNYAPINHFMRPDTRWTMGAFVNYEINEHFNPYLEAMVMSDRTVAQIAESGTFFNEQYDISIDSDMISETQRTQIMDAFGVLPGEDFSVYIGKRNVEGGPRQSRLETNSQRLTLGTDGTIDDNWTYDVAFQFNRTSSGVGYINDFFAPRITTAVDAGAVPCADVAGCIPYDVFTYNGVTSEQAATLTGVGIIDGLIEETIVGGFVTGDLFTISGSSDPVSVVLGAEVRDQTFDVLADEVFSQGLLLGQGGATPSVTGGIKSKEIFGEASFPLLQGAEGAESLVLDLGFRWADYDLFDAQTTYKVGLDYMPMDGLKFRTSFNHAVRVPNVTELYTPQSLGLWTGTDPCTGATPEYTEEQCARTGVLAGEYGTVTASPAGQYNATFGGETALEPEIAETLTVGVVSNPMDNFNISVDYFSIEIEDTINNIGSEVIVRQCAENDTQYFFVLITRGNGGSLWRGTLGFVTDINVNLGSQVWEGVDVNMNYTMEIDAGYLTATFIGTKMLTKETNPIPGDNRASYDCVGNLNTNCFATPDWRHSLKVSFTPADSFWTVDAKWRYYGDVGYTATDGPDTLALGGLGAQSYFDVNVGADLNENIGFLFGINNLTDKEPPMVGNTLSTNANAVAGFYDPLGRYIHASVTFRY